MLHIWCLFVDDRYVGYLVSYDPDIDSKQDVSLVLFYF